MNEKQQAGAQAGGITPHLVVRDAAAAIDLYRNAFGAEELFRIPSPDGKQLMHAEMSLGGGRLMLAEEAAAMGAASPLQLGGTPVTLHLMVPDCDTAVARAAAAGCTVVMPPTDMFWGDRYARLSDPFGHSWSLSTHLRDVSLEEMQEGLKAALAEPGKSQ